MIPKFKRYWNFPVRKLVAPAGYFFFDDAYDFVGDRYFHSEWRGIYSCWGLIIDSSLRDELRGIEGRTQVFYTGEWHQIKKKRIIESLVRLQKTRQERQLHENPAIPDQTQNILYDPEFLGVEETPQESKDRFRSFYKKKSNYHIDILIRNEIVSKDIVSWIYSGKTKSYLQLRNGKIKALSSFEWVNMIVIPGRLASSVSCLQCATIGWMTHRSVFLAAHEVRRENWRLA